MFNMPAQPLHSKISKKWRANVTPICEIDFGNYTSVRFYETSCTRMSTILLLKGSHIFFSLKIITYIWMLIMSIMVDDDEWRFWMDSGWIEGLICPSCLPLDLRALNIQHKLKSNLSWKEIISCSIYFFSNFYGQRKKWKHKYIRVDNFLSGPTTKRWGGVGQNVNHYKD